MLVEKQYHYDEPVGIYSHESHERLARGVMQDLTRYEEVHKTAVDATELPHFGAEAAPSEESRLSSIVESRDARLGYALALASPDQTDSAAKRGVLYHIDREDPRVLEHKELVVARPETFQSNRDYKAQIEGLMERFDKGELEVTMRMLGKMTCSLELSREMRAVNDDELAGLSVAGRMRQAAKVQRTKSILKRVAGVEPYVLGALHIDRQHELRALFPNFQSFDETLENPDPNEHILDWEEFVETASNLIQAEADPDSSVTHVNVRHEIGDKLYYIKLVSEEGQLSGIQMLCDDTGAWKTQLFELGAAEEDGQDDLNTLSPIWDKSDILNSLQSGETIDNKCYEYYRRLAEKSIEDSFNRPDNLILIPPMTSKRPAA